ncbi:hypothetical protein TNCT_480271 [Trichonephila clavata]|uniref:Uncharacterized protein n=1 Tax=Trichonephila clavata TaxID=2740835 RepID=A0A8X6LTV0_TRICU|nr:hypothetical protein TNCT_480271 [Trichonephila clavata]
MPDDTCHFLYDTKVAVYDLWNNIQCLINSMPDRVALKSCFVTLFGSRPLPSEETMTYTIVPCYIIETRVNERNKPRINEAFNDASLVVKIAIRELLEAIKSTQVNSDHNCEERNRT